MTAVFTTIEAVETISLTLETSDARQSDAEAQLDRAIALIIAVVELNRPRLINEAQIIYESGDYRTQVMVRSLRLIDSNSSESNQRQLSFTADTIWKVSRALGNDEGRPIERIITTDLVRVY